MPTDTPDMSRAALEALAERLARYSVRQSNALEDDLLQAAATLRALAARVIELEGENERLREALGSARLIAVDAQFRATYLFTALEQIADIARAALETDNAE